VPPDRFQKLSHYLSSNRKNRRDQRNYRWAKTNKRGDASEDADIKRGVLITSQAVLGLQNLQRGYPKPY
jgi:hypothetical protein